MWKSNDSVFLLLRLEQRVSKVLLSGPASLPWHEKDIRQLLRLVFLAPARTDAEYGFWLTQILKPWPIVFQARLLYIITGPEEQNGRPILWCSGGVSLVWLSQVGVFVLSL